MDRSSSQPNEANAGEQEIENKARVVSYRRRVHRQRDPEIERGRRKRERGGGLTMVAPTRVRSKPSRSCRSERRRGRRGGGGTRLVRFVLGRFGWGGGETVPEGGEASRSARSTRPGPGPSAPFPARLGNSSCMGFRSSSLRARVHLGT